MPLVKQNVMKFEVFILGGQRNDQPKNVDSCDLFILIIIIIIIIFFRWVFLECTETIATALIPLVTNFPEIWPFIIGFSFTVWTKIRPLMAH